MKDVQCYELFGGISLKDHAFSFFYVCPNLLDHFTHVGICSDTDHYFIDILLDLYICNIYTSKPLDVVQSLYFGSLLPKYRDCTTSSGFELYLMCCGVMLLLLIM